MAWMWQVVHVTLAGTAQEALLQLLLSPSAMTQNPSAHVQMGTTQEDSAGQVRNPTIREFHDNKLQQS